MTINRRVKVITTTIVIYVIRLRARIRRTKADYRGFATTADYSVSPRLGSVDRVEGPILWIRAS